MGNRMTIRRTVFVYLLLHTAIIVLLVLLLGQSRIAPDKTMLMLAVIAGCVFLILYTTHMIIQSVNNEIMRKAKRLYQFSADLQTMLATMREYETELGRRTSIIRECGNELEQRVGMITAYSDRINELLAMAKSIHDDDAAESDAERKSD